MQSDELEPYELDEELEARPTLTKLFESILDDVGTVRGFVYQLGIDADNWEWKDNPMAPVTITQARVGYSLLTFLKEMHLENRAHAESTKELLSQILEELKKR